MFGNPVFGTHGDIFGCLSTSLKMVSPSNHKPLIPPRSSYGYTFVGLHGFRSKLSPWCDERGFPNML